MLNGAELSKEGLKQMDTQGKSSLTPEKVQTHAKYRAFPTTIKLELDLQERETCHVSCYVIHLF